MARLQWLADELVRLNMDRIVTAATPAIRAGKTIPIVLAAAADPVTPKSAKELLLRADEGIV